MPRFFFTLAKSCAETLPQGSPGCGGLIWVCFALPEEARPFRACLSGLPHARLVLTGMGPEQAWRVLQGQYREARPLAVLSCGFAGALRPGLPVGSVIFATDDPVWAQRLESAGAVPARFLTRARIVTTAAEKSELWRNSGADAVEMESGAIVQWCRRKNIPAVIVRVVSDAADETLPLDFTGFVRSDGRFDRWSLLCTVLWRPTLWPALWRLARRTRWAARRLALVLATVLTTVPASAERSSR